MKYKGELALLVTAIMYGLFGVFSRIISFNIPLFYQMWSRNVFGIVVMLIIFKLFGSWQKIKPRDIIWFFLRSLGGFISFIGIYLGFIYLDFATNYFVSYAAATIAGYGFGVWLLREKLTRINLISLALSLLGLSLIFKASWQPERLLYLLISTIGGLATSVWTVGSKKISGSYSNLQLNLVDSVLALILPFILSLIFREEWGWPQLNFLWLASLLFQLIFIVIGFLIVYGFKYVDAQRGSLILLFDIIVGIILGYLVFHEAVSPVKFFGGSLILTAMILPHLKLNRFKSFK